MSYIKNEKGKPKITTNLAFCALLEGKLPSEHIEFNTLFKKFDEKVQEENSAVKPSALGRSHGDWYEWLLAICAWNHFASDQNSHLAILLPNVAQFDVSTLYEKRLNDLIIDLKKKVSESKVQLITSNPDFVIINGDLAKSKLGQISIIDDISVDNLITLEKIYLKFIGSCSFEHIEGYISVKTSLRGDRRFQPAHEGSLMKALYTHLQTREWIITPKGLKYYAITTEMSEADKNALKTVATHSLTTVFSLPQAAVDEAYVVNTLQQARLAFSEILS